MIKRVWHVFIVLLLLHLILAGGFVAWLYTSGRLDKDRLTQVYEMFKPTIAAQAAEEAQLAAQIEQEQRRQADAARLEAAKDGPLTLSQRLAESRQKDERAMLRLDRLERARSDIQSQIERAEAALAQRSAELDKARAEFDQFINDRTQQLQESDFKQAVALLAAQEPQQAKAMLQTLLAQGEQDRVVAYLAAMQKRLAAKVLAEFKEPAEVVQATQLIEALRLRGVFTMNPTEGDNT